MTTTIGLISEKGGSGKSTTAIHLAVALARRQQRVLLVDSDKAPGSAVRMWSASRNETDIDVIGLDRPTLDKDLKKLGRQDDVQIIDGVANDPLMAVAAIKAADLVLIPVQATPNDLWALSGLVDLDSHGFVLTGDAIGAQSPYATSHPGIFAVGDVRAGSVKRVAASVGEGSVVISKVWEHIRT